MRQHGDEAIYSRLHRKAGERMTDVKWIKIYTDMVSNKKIRRIRTLPEGNNIALIWVFLLAQAGESNKSGALFLTDTLPFRPEDLAVEFDFEIPVINLAIITLEKFSMIEVFDDVIYIKNWGEYQNINGLEKIRELGRVRVANYRENHKLIPDSNVTCNVTLTPGNATELELDKELEKELEIETKKKAVKKPALQILKKTFGEKVHLSKQEHEKLIEKNGEEATNQMISILDNWYLTKGNKPNKSDYHTMVGVGWVIKRFNEDKQRQGGSPGKQVNRPKSFDAIDEWAAMTEGMDA